ncbi:glycoside hydrolase family 66 protein [Tepidibacillus infernus]|uniref:glycoside hydrolase family 66 protein n=1 Tax=Tepidibacillus infernus TaxID=1806172 RepID=UPI003B691E89
MGQVKIHHLDVYPDKAQYHPREQGSIIVEIAGNQEAMIQIKVSFKRLHQLEWEEKMEIYLEKAIFKQISIPFEVPNEIWEGFGVNIQLFANGKYLAQKSTAWDVVDHWRRAPRYGFLSDFHQDEKGQLNDVDSLNKFHLNIIQFYDWMYRHDNMIPPAENFVDPMGRTLSYPVVREKINALHEKGMAALAYGAVYASLKDFHEQHKEWGLYKNNGDPYHLIDIFYIMDISPDSPWNKHMISEFRKVMEEGFDGIHMDQYGFPKKAFRHVNGRKELVDLANCYPALINQTKKHLKEVNAEVGLIFNNVSNYPVHTTAKADQDAIYIEVWPPVIHLRELKALIDRGRELSDDKHVILSAYLPSFKQTEGYDQYDQTAAENGALLTMATIFASGGYHLLIGEENKVLTEAYYPSYGTMSNIFIEEVRKYYDFIVRYGKLLYDHQLVDLSFVYTGGINTEISFQGEAAYTPNGDVNTVWTMVKQLPDYQIIHLINLVGLEDDYWEHGKKQRPKKQKEITCTVLIEKEVNGVYLASPDFENTEPIKLNDQIVSHEHGKAIQFTIPTLSIWDMVYIEFVQ